MLMMLTRIPYPPVSLAFRIPQPGALVSTHGNPLLSYTNGAVNRMRRSVLLISGGPCLDRYIEYPWGT